MDQSCVRMHASTLEDFEARRSTAIRAMVAMIAGFMEASDEDEERVAEARVSLTELLAEWWDERNLCLEAIQPEHPAIQRKANR